MKTIWQNLSAFRRKFLPTQGERFDDMMLDFVATFPGRCFVCSYYRYGRRELGVNKPTPAHLCIEQQGAKTP